MEEFAKLCCNIVEDFYGSFLAQIFRQLAQFGRLSVQQIAQRCRLPLRQVKSGVATMVQLRLVYHHNTGFESSTYQANTTNAYNIMRTGRIIEYVGWKLGSSAADVLENLAALGFATAHELEAQVVSDENLTSLIDKSRFRTLLQLLISAKYIKAVREAHFQSPADRRQHAERALHSEGVYPSGTGRKVALDAETMVDLEIEKRVDGHVSAYDVLQELNQDPTQDTTTLTIDYSSLVTRIRNDRVAKIAEKIFGRQFGQVARAACSQIEETAPKSLPARLLEEPESSLQRLEMSRIGSDVFESRATGEARINGANGHHGRRVNGGLGEDRVLEHQLAVLAEGSFSFLGLNPTDPRSWMIDKSKLNNFLWDKEMYRLISESLPEPALRVIRMLAEKGKLDERTMLDAGLLNAKELRKCLSALQTMGFLELQEVPKDPQRQPKSTIFLYFYDAERVRKVFLDKLYKTMSRMYERMHVEHDKVSSTLTKVERFDPGTEKDFLAPAELEELYEWRQRESWFISEIHRMDDSIAILRDI